MCIKVRISISMYILISYAYMQSWILKWRREKLSCNSRTCPQDATVNNGYGKLKEMLRSTLKTKSDQFKDVVNFSNKTYFRSESKLLNKN